MILLANVCGVGSLKVAKSRESRLEGRGEKEGAGRRREKEEVG